MHLPNLETLHLENVLLTKEFDINFKLPDSHQLNSLTLDGSKELVANLIPKKILKKIPKLQSVYLRNTNLKKLNPDDFPNSHISISIIHNKLVCNCDMKWLIEGGKKHVTILEEETTECEYPVEANHKNLYNYLTKLDCSYNTEQKDHTPAKDNDHNKHKHIIIANSMHDEDDEKMSTLLIIIIVIVVLTFVVFIIAIIFYILTKERKCVNVGRKQKEPTLKELQQASSEDKLLDTNYKTTKD